MRDKVNKLSQSLSYAYIDGDKGGKKYKDSIGSSLYKTEEVKKSESKDVFKVKS